MTFQHLQQLYAVKRSLVLWVAMAESRVLPALLGFVANIYNQSAKFQLKVYEDPDVIFPPSMFAGLSPCQTTEF